MRNVTRRGRARRAGKPILFFPARHDHWLVQTGDGWAAHVAGAIGVSTDAQASWWGGRGIGTVPHALIAAYGGDTVAAAAAFAARFASRCQRDRPGRLRERLGRARRSRSPTASATTSGACAWTRREPVDVALADEPRRRRSTAASRRARAQVRAALDDAGHRHVRIVVSGGFDRGEIAALRGRVAPVDAYGVGSSLLRGGNDFTADIVRVDGQAVSKVGREERPNDRLERVVY